MALVDAIANVITTLADGDLFYVGEDLTGSYQDGQAAASVIKSYVLTGPVAVVGNATAGASIRLPEDTDNGSNYVALKAPDTLSGNLTFTLPSADGTNGQALVTNASGVLSFATVGAAAPLTLAGGTVTDPSTPLTITQTWNDAADTFTGFEIDVTDTASAAASLLADFQVGGSSKAKIDKAGKITSEKIQLTSTTGDGGGTNGGQLEFVAGTTTWLFTSPAEGQLRFGRYNKAFSIFYNTAVEQRQSSDLLLSWAATSPDGVADLGVYRNAAGVLEINSGTAGTLRDLYARNVRTASVAVASLVAAGTAGAGARAFVNDSSVTTFGSTVSAGGSNLVPVYSDGTNWKVG